VFGVLRHGLAAVLGDGLPPADAGSLADREPEAAVLRVLFEAAPALLEPAWFKELPKPAGGAAVPAPGEALSLGLGDGDGDVDDCDGDGDADVGLLDGVGGGLIVGVEADFVGFGAGQDGLTMGIALGLIDELW